MLMLRTAEGDGDAALSFARKFPDDVEIYQGVNVPGFLALGPDDRDIGATSDAHRIDVRIARGRFGHSAGPFLFQVSIWAPAAFRDEFLKWYEIDHFPILLECSEWHGGRLVEEQVAEGCQFHALHNLETQTALDSDARKRSRATPWFQKLAQHEWFDKGFVRALFRRAAHSP